MSVRNANCVTLFLVSFVTGITNTVCDYADPTAYGLADVAHTNMNPLELTLRSNSLEWFQSGMQLFAYVKYNGYKWGKTDLTWDFLGGSSHVPADLVHKAAKKTFGMWSAKTPFRFDRVKSGQKPDIRFSFEWFDFSIEPLIVDIRFPEKEDELDKKGVDIVFNDKFDWEKQPLSPNWYNINSVMLHAVTRGLGIGRKGGEQSVTHILHSHFYSFVDMSIHDNDFNLVQELYHFPKN